MVGLTSAAGVVGFLSEPDTDLQVFALERLNEQIDSTWTEVAGSVGEIEALYEDEDFPERELAALVAAKVYYNLQAYDESMTFALGAGKLFNIDKQGEFEDTIISKCVDTYIALSAASRTTTSSDSAEATEKLAQSFLAVGDGAASTAASMSSPTTPFSQSALPSKSSLYRQNTESEAPAAESNTTDSTAAVQLGPAAQKQLVSVVERLFEHCYREGRYRQVIGIAIEAKNLDKIREAIQRSRKGQGKGKTVAVGGDDRGEELMDYVLDVCMDIVQELSFRTDILKLILDLLTELPTPQYFSITKCIVYLNQPETAADMLVSLVKKDDNKALAVAYQLCFDIFENSTQEFLKKLRHSLPYGKQHDSEEESSGDSKSSLSKRERDIYTAMDDILEGLKSLELNMEFLYMNNKTDRKLLDKVKDSLEARNSIFHTAVSLANAFMHAGTTNDKFFRENLEWLGKAVNWSKFTATAALGVIHRGNLGCGLKLLSPYLPKDSIAGANSGSAYSQGGSLYAMGLIYANHETFASELIRKQFNDTNEEVVQHGAALGLGCASMATGDEGIFEDLKNVLYSDSAINGEAVGVAMGLVMLGTGNLSALENMIQYAHETQHEKIIRGLSLGMALIMYGRQEAADELVNGLLDDPDPILRYGGIQTIMLAYCGSGSNKAVRRLLHVAVSDVSDDVRRVAVMALGFILFRKPKSVPRMVELLSESYNPHVRYGAAMALGISCAGTGLDEAIDLLEPMIKDPTDFVRQGALIALSMIMVQQNEVMNPKVGTIRKTLQKAISDRHEDAMTKFGSAVSLGIIDAGGRNCTISLQTQTGNLNMAGIVGMAVFTQYWYWFPLTHFLSLSFTPTAIIAVDHNLNVPAFKYHSATRPSLFDYPPEQEAKIEEAPKKVETAVLSTTAQAKRRALQRERKQRRESDAGDEAKTPKTEVDDKMDTDEPITKDDEKKDDDEKEKSDSSLDKPEDKKHLAEGLRKKLEKEKVGYELENLSRVLPPQVRFISFPNSRYKPVKKPTGGVILVNDTRPDEKVELKELRAKQRGRSAYPPSKAQQERDLAQSSSTRARGAQVPGGVDPIAPLGAELNEDDESGAAAGASILNALDEGEEEADVPREFQYDPEADESDS